jgi:hypothetical protein
VIPLYKYLSSDGAPNAGSREVAKDHGHENLQLADGQTPLQLPADFCGARFGIAADPKIDVWDHELEWHDTERSPQDHLPLQRNHGKELMMQVVLKLLAQLPKQSPEQVGEFQIDLDALRFKTIQYFPFGKDCVLEIVLYQPARDSRPRSNMADYPEVGLSRPWNYTRERTETGREWLGRSNRLAKLRQQTEWCEEYNGEAESHKLGGNFW